MIYNIVLVSAMIQHESATGVHMSPPSRASLPPPTTSPPLGGRRAQSELPALCRGLPLAPCFNPSQVCMSVPISHFMSRHLPYPHVLSLCLHLCLYSCPENRFIYAICIDSTYSSYISVPFLCVNEKDENGNFVLYTTDRIGCSLQ